MIEDMSKINIAIVHIKPVVAEKLRMMLIVDAGIDATRISVQNDPAPFNECLLEDTAFDVIFIGDHSPQAGCLAFIRRLAIMMPESAIIFVPSQYDLRQASDALAAGAQDIMGVLPTNGPALTKALAHGMERMKLRNQLKATNQRLMRLNEEKNRFLGMAAHDLRGPIGNMGGLAELILNDAGHLLDDDHVEFLKIIQRSSTSMVRLIEDLLDMSKIESGRHVLRLSRIGFKEFIDQAVRQCVRSARAKNIVIESACPEQVEIDVDFDKLNQVMENLISNAVKYSPPGSRVSVQGTLCGEHDIEVWVQDWGPGIAKEEVERIFNPFCRGAARPTAGEHSTGLGLPIVKRIVGEHKGQVGVRSTLGVGSIFWFRLPRCGAADVSAT